MKKAMRWAAQGIIGCILFFGLQRLWVLSGLPYLEVRVSGFDVNALIGTQTRIIAAILFIAAQFLAWLIFRKGRLQTAA